MYVNFIIFLLWHLCMCGNIIQNRLVLFTPFRSCRCCCYRLITTKRVLPIDCFIILLFFRTKPFCWACWGNADHGVGLSEGSQSITRSGRKYERLAGRQPGSFELISLSGCLAILLITNRFFYVCKWICLHKNEWMMIVWDLFYTISLLSQGLNNQT